jgi:hypothetical protein
MSRRGEFKPHTVKLLQLYGAGERDYFLLAQECGMTPQAVRAALSVRGLTKNRPRNEVLSGGKRVQIDVPIGTVTAAKQRGWSTARLVYTLMYVIAQDNLFESVLDDAETA